jgi:4-amino-4-deoxy-L-arabinose transferase-like glycosyltransferase
MTEASFADTPAGVTKRNRLILFALWLLFYSSLTLITPDADSVHAEVSREMLLRHDWVTLFANGVRYLERAPLLYWSMAASFKLFRVRTAAARLPLAFTVLALALIVEAFARRAFASTRAGLYAGLILLSSFGIFIFTRINIPDAMVCLWRALALYYYWLTEQSDPLQNRVPHGPPLGTRVFPGARSCR